MKRREFYLELSRKLQNGETVKVRTDLEKGSHSFEEPERVPFLKKSLPAGRRSWSSVAGIFPWPSKRRRRLISPSRWWMTGWNLQTGSVFAGGPGADHEL